MTEDVKRVHPFILRSVTAPDGELVGTVRDEGRKLLLLPLSPEAAQECVSSPEYEHLLPTPVTVRDIELVCKHHAIDLVALCGLEEDSLSVVPLETVPLILTKEEE
jgi:hypothetical protein